MKNKLSLIIAALITTALITMGIGVIRNVNARNAQPASNTNCHPGYSK